MVVNYQAVVPTTWNASPRDGKGRMGAYESALKGVRLAKPDQPLEILRTVHSFDPCLACAVHVVDARGRAIGAYRLRLQEVFLNFVTLNRRKRFDSSRLDPLNALLFVLLHLMVVFQLLTGLQLYVVGLESGISSVGPWWPWLMHVSTDWTQTVFGGLGGVRVAHHIMMYSILAWAVVHIYYEVWRAVVWKGGDIAISFAGYKYAPAEPEQFRVCGCRSP